MADYRIEAAADPASGLFYVQVFCPSHATVAAARTKPIYQSLEEAQRKVGETISAAIANSKNDAVPEWKAILFDNT